MELLAVGDAPLAVAFVREHSSQYTTLCHASRHAPVNVGSTTNIRATITATVLLFRRSTCLLPSTFPTLSICSKAVAPSAARQSPGSRYLLRRTLSTAPTTRMVNGAEDQSLGKMTERGAFILFEGVDRCGKTTQANLLVENLTKAGHDACFMRFPGERRREAIDRSTECVRPSWFLHTPDT